MLELRVKRVGKFASDTSPPVVIVTVENRERDGKFASIDVFEFCDLHGQNGFFRWIALFSTTVYLERQVHRYSVEFLNELDQAEYVKRVTRDRIRAEEADKAWAKFQNGEIALGFDIDPDSPLGRLP